MSENTSWEVEKQEFIVLVGLLEKQFNLDEEFGDSMEEVFRAEQLAWEVEKYIYKHWGATKDNVKKGDTVYEGTSSNDVVDCFLYEEADKYWEDDEFGGQMHMTSASGQCFTTCAAAMVQSTCERITFCIEEAGIKTFREALKYDRDL